MFDRTFFERQFMEHAQQFCRERKLSGPVVEVLLDDGTVLRLRAVTQIRENWLGLSVYGEGNQSRLILCPYFTIKRITFAVPASSEDGILSLPAKP